MSFGEPIDLSNLATQLGMNQSDLQSALGPDANQLAQDATSTGVSTSARLDQANKDAHDQLIANLNKRGMLNSGQTAFLLDRQNTAYRQAQFDARQKLLGYLQQYQQGYEAAQNQKATSLAQAYSDAANRVVQQNQSSPGVHANFVHYDFAGNPVYADASGNQFYADGTPYAGFAGGPPSAVLRTPAPAPARAQAPALPTLPSRTRTVGL